MKIKSANVNILPQGRATKYFATKATNGHKEEQLISIVFICAIRGNQKNPAHVSGAGSLFNLTNIHVLIQKYGRVVRNYIESGTVISLVFPEQAVDPLFFFQQRIVVSFFLLP